MRRSILSFGLFQAVLLAAAPPLAVKGPAKWVQCVAFSPDGKRVVAGNDEGRLWVVNAAGSRGVGS